MLDLGMLMIAGAQNPAMGPQLDAMGIPVPGGGAPGIGPWETTVNPAAQAPGAGFGDLAKGLQGVKVPGPVTPIMSGGVIGGVKPPQPDTAGLRQGAPAIQALMQALMQRSQGPVVPNLGSLVRGAV